MSKLSILIQGRRDSTRVKDKMLREFGGPGNCLFSRCCEKVDIASRDFADVAICVAVHEEVFFDIACDRIDGDFVRIKRSYDSAHSDDARIVDSFYDQIPSDPILIVSACTPFVSTTKIRQAIEMMLTDEHRFGLMSVVELRRWVWDQRGTILNENPGISSTQQMKPFFVAANALYGFSKKFYVDGGYGFFWPIRGPGPRMFCLSDLEATDIDTERDFLIAEAIGKEYEGWQV